MTSGRRYLLIPRAVTLSGRHLLLVRETPLGRTLSPGRWHLPGGEALEGESPQKAVERLVRHRTGLNVDVLGCLDALAKRGPDPATGKPAPLLHLFFLCRPADGSPGELLPGEGTSLAIAASADPDEAAGAGGAVGGGAGGRAQAGEAAGAGGGAGVGAGGGAQAGAGQRQVRPRAQLGAAWGWTDLASGLRALKHDLVGPAVVRYLAELESGGR
jgi:ADP-ribose pyrophosphatase YjhB (NUDIX family)